MRKLIYLAAVLAFAMSSAVQAQSIVKFGDYTRVGNMKRAGGHHHCKMTGKCTY